MKSFPAVWPIHPFLLWMDIVSVGKLHSTLPTVHHSLNMVAPSADFLIYSAPNSLRLRGDLKLITATALVLVALAGLVDDVPLPILPSLEPPAERDPSP